MGLSRIGALMLGFVLSSIPAYPQTVQGPRCLHGESETEVQAQRRSDAFDAAELINRAIARHARRSDYPSWSELAASPVIASMRGVFGWAGDLARRMEWGREQPLPGWRIHYVASAEGYAFSLTDTRDPCRLTFASDDTGVVTEGQPANPRRQLRIVPLDSSQ